MEKCDYCHSDTGQVTDGLHAGCGAEFQRRVDEHMCGACGEEERALLSIYCPDCEEMPNYLGYPPEEA